MSVHVQITPDTSKSFEPRYKSNQAPPQPEGNLPLVPLSKLGEQHPRRCSVRSKSQSRTILQGQKALIIVHVSFTMPKKAFVPLMAVTW